LRSPHFAIAIGKDVRARRVLEQLVEYPTAWVPVDHCRGLVLEMTEVESSGEGAVIVGR
jgi:hypothetical protein